MLSVVLLSVVMLSVVMLSVVMLSVIMQSVAILSVAMLSIVAPFHTVSHLQPSLIFSGQAEAYPSRATYRTLLSE
jgi:hypothetical protein